MTPIQLYTWGTPNGQKASIMLEEAGLPYTIHPIDISKGGTQTPDYLAMNPNGKIPVIHDPDQDRTVLESGAILLYLAERAGKFMPVLGDETVSWMFFQAAHVGPMLGQLGFFRLAAAEQLPLAIDRFDRESQRVLRVLDTRLARSAFLGGGDYGLADIMTWPWIRSAQLRLGLELGELAHLMRWFAEIAARPAVQRGLAIPAAAPVPAPAAVSGPDPQR